MAYDNLLFEVKDQIARITFNRPNVLNALNRKTMDELGDCLKQVRARRCDPRADSHRRGRESVHRRRGHQ